MWRRQITQWIAKVGPGTGFLLCTMLTCSVLSWVFNYASCTSYELSMKGFVTIFGRVLCHENFFDLLASSISLLSLGLVWEEDLGTVFFLALFAVETALMQLPEAFFHIVSSTSCCTAGSFGILYSMWVIYCCALPPSPFVFSRIRLNPRFIPIGTLVVFLALMGGRGWRGMVFGAICGYASVVGCPRVCWEYIRSPRYDDLLGGR